MTDLFLKRLSLLQEKGAIPEIYSQYLEEFYSSYLRALKLKKPTAEILEVFLIFLEEAKKQCRTPFQFELYHKKIRTNIFRIVGAIRIVKFYEQKT